MASGSQKTSLTKSSGPTLEIEYVELDGLHFNPSNPRTHSKKQIRQIAESIKVFGFLVPILINLLGNIIAGHGRALAAQLLGWTLVPVIRVEHLSEAQIRAYNIADNRLCENSEWNKRLLGEQFKILEASELSFGIDTTGFEPAEIRLFIEGLIEPDQDDGSITDTLPASGPAISKLGDMWLLGEHRLLCGDALDPASYSRLMAGKKAALVFTDPPFNVRIDGHASGLGRHRHREFVMASGEMDSPEYRAFLSCSLQNAARNSQSGSIHYVCMDWGHIRPLLAAGGEVYSELKNLCVWTKDNGGMGSFYRSQHELVFVFKYGKTAHRNNIQLGKFGRYRTNVWSYPGARSLSQSGTEGNLLELHPTVKPTAMVADAILDCSARGELVLDPFLGSGTTILAAARTGRICYGLEIDPLYVDTIVRRWQAATGLTATNEAGESFRALEEAAHV